MTIHNELGMKLGLRQGDLGEIFVKSEVLNESTGQVIEVEFLIDTGFNGHLQITEADANLLGLSSNETGKAKGYDGNERDIPLVKTPIKLFGAQIANFPIHVVTNGMSLIGSRMLKDLKLMLIVDYTSRLTTITGDQSVRRAVISAIDENVK